MKPKIHECLATDELRPAMSYAFVTKEETAATDAHILVVHRTSEIFDDLFIPQIPEGGLFVGKEPLVDLAKKDVLKVNFIESHSILEVIHQDRYKKLTKRYFDVKMAKDVDFQYPKYNSVFPDGQEKISGIGLNPAYLNRLCKALGAENGVNLQFYGEHRPIIVKPHSSDYPTAKGLIMPVMSN